MAETIETYNKIKSLIENKADLPWDLVSQKVITLIYQHQNIKALIDHRDVQNKNILFMAVLVGNDLECLKLINYLISKGANPLEKDSLRQTIIYYAARYNKIEVVRRLLQFNPSPHDTDYFNQNPLYFAAKYNKFTEIAQMLVNHGIDLNVKDNNGQTVLYYAAASGNLPMCQLLVSNGCNIASTDKSREKAINYARKKGHGHIVDFLNNYRPETKKIPKIQPIKHHQQESSQNIEKRKKKQNNRNLYSLVYTNQDGQVHTLTLDQLHKFSQVNAEYFKLYQMITQPDTHFDPLAVNPPDKKFEKTALKIFNHFWRVEHAFIFHDPVNYVELGLFDYPKIVKYPMDFGAIRRKLTLNCYENEIQFQGDMNLVFDNCILYNGQEKGYGRIALQMKMEFNTMFAKEFA